MPCRFAQETDENGDENVYGINNARTMHNILFHTFGTACRCEYYNNAHNSKERFEFIDVGAVCFVFYFVFLSFLLSSIHLFCSLFSFDAFCFAISHFVCDFLLLFIRLLSFYFFLIPFIYGLDYIAVRAHIRALLLFPIWIFILHNIQSNKCNENRHFVEFQRQQQQQLNSANACRCFCFDYYYSLFLISVLVALQIVNFN